MNADNQTEKNEIWQITSWPVLLQTMCGQVATNALLNELAE
jgi:hypothetical protein